MKKKKRAIILIVFILIFTFQLISLMNTTTTAEILTYPAASIEVKEDIAYVAERTGGIELIDVSDPYNLENLGRFNDDTGNFIELVINENYLYAASGESGLVIFDISGSTSSISPLSKIYDLANITRFLTIQNEIAYIDINGEGFAIIDVSDPTTPIVLSRTAKDTNPALDFIDSRDIAIKDNFAFLVGYASGITVFDLSDKSNPAQLYTYTEFPGTSESLHVQSIEIVDDIAYIAADTSGLVALDISDPSDISVLGRFNVTTLTIVSEVYIEGNHAYLITSNHINFEYGLRIINITEPSTFLEINNYIAIETMTEDFYVDSVNDLIYLSHSDARISVLDVSDINNLILIETYEIAVTITTPADNGNYPLLSLFGIVVILIITRKKKRILFG
ncbi:MAG: hypothetical protein GOP50_05455 [Candidatus Heimdallarchaeota archaeon]|nr:hypothetical protein [Candidatus Heimdallarchaeota archaeon]